MFMAAVPTARAFQHPGIPLTLADLSTVKSNLTKSPWSSGYAALQADWLANTNYGMHGPFTYVNRNNDGNYDNEGAWESDMQAVFDLARMWYFTSDSNYAKKSHEILLAWAATQTNYGGIEASFDLGDYAYRYAGGADILRGTWPGWTASDTATVSNYFARVFWPCLAVPGEVATGSQGMEDLTAAVAIAVFNDDTNKFNEVLSSFLMDADSGLCDTYANGEMGDTGRDQGHAGLFVFDLAWIGEVFWKQGVDVFSIGGDRIHACGEYYTRYNGSSSLQTNLPYVPIGAPFWGVFNNIGGSPGSAGLNGLAPNIIHAAYAVRLGLQTPFMDLYGLRGWDEDGFVYYKTTDSSAATPASVTTLPLTASVSGGLTSANLNGCTPAGSASYSGGTWTLTGGYAGGDPWDTAGNDTVHFVHQQVSGDFVMTAKVNSVSATDGHAKAGIMMRDSLGTATYRVWVAITDSTTYERGMIGWSDLPYGSNAESESSTISRKPYWVKIERVGDRVQTFTSIDGGDWAPAGTADFNGLPGTIYVGLFNTSFETGTLGTATFSNVRLTGGNNGEALQAPPAPFAIYASPGAGQVPLHWNESFMATSYNVLRSAIDGGPYTAIATVTNPSYVDTNVAANTTYHYVVSASNAAGTSGNSKQDSATTAPAPSAPAGLTALRGNGQATLVWSASIGATSYNVKRSTTSGSGYVAVASVTDASCVDTGLTNGVTYYYVVSAVSAAGEGADSSETTVTPYAGAPAALFWSGAVNGSWNTTAANWLSNGVSADFQAGSAVIFDDSATGSTTVSNVVTVSPASIVFNNSLDYYYVYSSPIGGSGSLTKLGGAEVFLGGANSFSGGATVLDGKLTIQNASALGAGTLTLNGGTFDTYDTLTFGNNIFVTNSGSAIQLNSANNLTLSGTLSGNGSLTLGNDADNNSLYLSGVNSMSGGTVTIAGNNNYVRFATANAGNARVDWVFNNQPTRATFDFASGTISFGSLAGTGSIQGNFSGAMNLTISVGANGHSTTFPGVIHNNGWGTGSINLVKVGSGTLTLLGTNDYTGTTTVNAGELLVSTLSLAKGIYTVAGGATLGVTNVSGGSALVSNLTVSAGSALEFRGLASTALPLIAASNLTVNGSCALEIIGTNGLVAGNSYPLISYAGTANGSLENLQLRMPYGWRGALVSGGNLISLASLAVVSTVPPLIDVTITNQQFQISWPADRIGWRLQAQTNSLESGLGTNWTDIAASETNQIFMPIDAANGSLFFRLVYP